MFDSVLGWGYGAVALVVALVVGHGAGKLFVIGAPGGRNIAIDGLRGYLALGVFLHHSVVWYFYVRTAPWGLPPASVYRPMGALCVSLFFMITGYLFIGKLLDARRRPIDWLVLYASRVLRLAPLYLLAMVALFSMVGVMSHWQLQEPAPTLLRNVGHWLAFSLLTAPDLNAVHPTGPMIAIVTWSLAYEWLFYLTLPALAVALRVKVPWLLVMVCTSFVVWALLNKADVVFPTSFVKGALAALLARQARIAALLRAPAFSALVPIAAGVALFGTVPGSVANLLVTLAFCTVACGNTVFGLLSNRPAIVLGDISYGIYLLHGLLLYATFTFIIGLERASTFAPAMHWGVVLLAAMAVVLAAALTYRFVESPAMRQTKRVAAWFRAKPRTIAVVAAPFPPPTVSAGAACENRPQEDS